MSTLRSFPLGRTHRTPEPGGRGSWQPPRRQSPWPRVETEVLDDPRTAHFAESPRAAVPTPRVLRLSRADGHGARRVPRSVTGSPAWPLDLPGPPHVSGV